MRKKIIISSLVALILIIGLAVRMYPDLPDLNLHHRIHWMMYGYDRVWYHNRGYLGPHKNTIDHLESEFGKLYPTGEKVIGLPVMSTKEALKSPYVPAGLILKKDDENCLVYGLIGGP